MHWTESVIANLDNIWVPHRNFELAKADLFSAALIGPGQVILAEGPTRAGKSSLVEKFTAELCGKLGGDQRYMPIVTVTAENNSTNGEFSSKAFTLAALQAVRHPMFSLDEFDFDIKRLRMISETSEGTLREALEQALKLRRTAYFVVDEAQHIAHIKGGAKAAGKFLDSLKCLASRTGARLVPVGTYQLTPLMQLSTHLLGRTTRIHIPRYRADVREDVIAFDQILAAYSLHLKFEDGKSLRSWNEYLYNGSLGCMGLLKAWLRDALRKALLTKHPVVRLRHFEMARRSDADLTCIMKEISDGEAKTQVQSVPAEPIEQSKPKTRPFRAKPRRFPVKANGVRA
jgi:hypothetical protein